MLTHSHESAEPVDLGPYALPSLSRRPARFQGGNPAPLHPDWSSAGAATWGIAFAVAVVVVMLPLEIYAFQFATGSVEASELDSFEPVRSPYLRGPFFWNGDRPTEVDLWRLEWRLDGPGEFDTVLGRLVATPGEGATASEEWVLVLSDGKRRPSSKTLRLEPKQ